MIKKVLAVFLCLSLLAVPVSAMRVQVTIGSTQGYTADENTKINKTLTMEAAPYTSQGRTMVPVRVITENLGAKVDWDEATQKVTITQGETVVELIIGSAEAKINGEVKVLDVAPEVVNYRTFIPMRFVGEAFGYTLQWVPGTQNVIVSDAPVVLKSEFSVATVQDILICASFMESFGAQLEMDEWIGFYAQAMAISDFRNYKAGLAQPMESIGPKEEVNALGIVPAVLDNAIELIMNASWYGELEISDPATYAQIEAYLATNPVQQVCSQEEYMTYIVDYISKISVVEE